MTPGGEGAERKVGDAENFTQFAHHIDRAEINEQHPQQFRHATHDGRIGSAHPLQRFVRRSLGQGTGQAEHQPQAQGRERQFDGHQRASGKRRAESVEIEIHGVFISRQVVQKADALN